MRGRATIRQELVVAEALANSQNLGPEFDNEGKQVRTAAERRASYARRAVRLRVELEQLDRILGG